MWKIFSICRFQIIRNWIVFLECVDEQCFNTKNSNLSIFFEKDVLTFQVSLQFKCYHSSLTDAPLYNIWIMSATQGNIVYDSSISITKINIFCVFLEKLSKLISDDPSSIFYKTFIQFKPSSLRIRSNNIKWHESCRELNMRIK